MLIMREKRLQNDKMGTLQLSFMEASRIARYSFSSMTENDLARTLLAETSEELRNLYKEQYPSSKERSTKAVAAERLCKQLTGVSYTEFLDVRDIILERTGAAGPKIFTL